MLKTTNASRRSTFLFPLAVMLAACGGPSQDTSTPSAKLLAQTNAQQASDALQAAGGNGVAAGEVAAAVAGDAGQLRNSSFYPNEYGITQIYSATGPIDKSNPFFKPFGNGRTCASCHAPADGFSLTPTELQERFERTAGMDPVFKTVDGSNSPLAPVQTLDQRRAAYSMLLTKGVIRIGMKIPANAEFEVAGVDDPYHYANANELSLFRRPLPAVNLRFQSNVMWDGRETLMDPASTNCLFGVLCYASISADLGHQANSALHDHAQATSDLTDADKNAIVNFESGLYAAQIFDGRAKLLTAAQGKGGPMELVKTDFYLGINDLFFGNVRTGGPFNPNSMQVYTAWYGARGQDADSNSTAYARQAIARGERIFLTKTFDITNVGGINDDLNIPVVKNATCVACHDAPQVGTNSFPFPENIGVSDGIHRTFDMPLYTLRNKTTNAVIQTTDPGQAMITGLWKDIGRFKTNSLRALASHPPYFHNGSAPTLRDVVLFYNSRFGIGYTPQEIDDLTAYLTAL